MYIGTTEAARQIGVSPRTLRRWIQKRLIGEPRVISKNDLGGKRGTMLIRMFGPDEIEALRRFAARYRSEVKARRRRPRDYKLHPKVKAWRAERRKAIQDCERTLHLAEWFEKNPLCGRNYKAWTDAHKQLALAELTEGDKLKLGTVETLRSKLTALKAEYTAAATAKPSKPVVTPEEARLTTQLGWGRSSVVRGGTR